MAISPDGMRVAFTVSGGRNQLYVKAMDQLTGAPVAGTDGGMSPFFSSDGQNLGFFSEGKLRTTPLMGGATRILCDSPHPRGASWGPDGRIVFSPLTVSGLSILSADGGTPEPLTELDPEEETRSHRWPQILPDGDWVLYTAWTGSQFRIEAASLESKEQKVLMEDGFFARYAPTGHLVFARDERLMAVPFDTNKMAPLGTPVSVVDEGVETDPQSGAAFYAFAADGTFAYVPASTESTAPEGTATLLEVDSLGTARPLTEARQGVHLPRISPDGNKVLMTIESGEESDAWLFDRARGTTTRLTFEGRNAAAIWTPDGNRFAFSSNRKGEFNLFWKPADGSTSAERLLRSSHPQFATSFSPDGKILAFSELHPESNFDIWLLPIGGESRPFLNSQFNEAGAVFSPNGRWIAYVSDETGQDEVYVRAYPGPEGKLQISNGGGNEPVWGPKGRIIYYRNRDWMMSVNIVTEDPFDVSRPRALFETHYDDAGVAYPGYDIAPDGQAFIMVRSERELVATQAHIVLNWFDELKRRAPASKN
jgi:Tol biopolymer transport system component